MSSLLLALKGLPADGVAPNAKPFDETAKRISDHLVRLVQVFFGVVVAQSLVLYRDVVVSPFAHDHFVAALALFSIYVMIVWSWIDWNTTMELRPYDFRPPSTDATPAERLVAHSERWRLYIDIAIVTVYAYVLFQVAPLVGNSDADIRYLLLGYPFVFSLYLGSGLTRIIRHGRIASNIQPIIEFLGVFLALVIAYILLSTTGLSPFLLNCAALVAALVGTRAYRWRRSQYRDSRRS